MRSPAASSSRYETYALVRARVTAEEREAIEVKGIRRAIRPYALTGFLDEPGTEDVISSEIDGMSVRIDVRHLDDTRRRRCSPNSQRSRSD